MIEEEWEHVIVEDDEVKITLRLSRRDIGVNFRSMDLFGELDIERKQYPEWSRTFYLRNR